MMLLLVLLVWYFVGYLLIVGLFPVSWERRPTLETLGFGVVEKKKKRKGLSGIMRHLAMINSPICTGAYRSNLLKELNIAHAKITPEEFVLIQEMIFVVAMICAFPFIEADMLLIWILIAALAAYLIPQVLLNSKIENIKRAIARELPDVIDLLALCVNAGLDFMLALKWVVEKSPRSVMTHELNVVLQEINVGKTRRDALKDLATRYAIPDLSTFSRTLIQADKMGTSVSEALNILAEDMRETRNTRAEDMATKAPFKLLIPLVLFIFPVVIVIIAGPIMIDFVEYNPMKQFGESVGGGE